MSAGKTCVLECSQVTLDWLILLEHQHWLHLPLLSVTHWRLVCEEAAECTATPPSSLKASKAEQRANLKSDCQGDPAAPVIGKFFEKPPSTNCTLTLDTQIYSSACVCLLVMSQMMTPSTQNKATVSDLSADEREWLKGNKAGMFQSHQFSLALFAKATCVQKHTTLNTQRAQQQPLFFLIKGLQ